MKLRVGFGQINPTVGDLDGNVRKILAAIREGERRGAQLLLFPELALCGYPPEDLLFKPAFIRAAGAALNRVRRAVRGPVTVVLGSVEERGRKLFNTAYLLRAGRIVARTAKMALPNYGVFDERRYFTPGERALVVDLPLGRSESVRTGLSICEDIWAGAASPTGPQARGGARLLINISASPYDADKAAARERVVTWQSRRTGLPMLYVNLVGGQDELVFDGGSLAVGPAGRILFRAPRFREGVFCAELPLAGGRAKGKGRFKPDRSAPRLTPVRQILQALLLGTRDYVEKNGFREVVVGLSGGVDSALTLAVAAAALGPERVRAVTMPSRYSSAATRRDAQRLARNLGVRLETLPIELIFQAAQATLRPVFRDRKPDTTEENLQARIRGFLLMALSNKFGWLVLAPGNKSELSTGYCTLYGDMVGGFAVIKDLTKTQVYGVSREVNRFFGRPVIPASVLRRAPTAELRPNQRDADTLPPYRRLDPVIRAYVEENRSAGEIRIRLRRPAGEIVRLLRLIDRNEYKRRQAPMGIKITPRAFGKDHRMPVTNRFRDV
ncbi:MAG: NAD+ synthase [Candidatus Omnitrophica bacterium CG11_big_fil_rev_8_21_14_0_20_64_10]|nr:MAG: NAD+ synthase [Candidatus Omnitrophica bacterium CG11_big_fil_rev_8_21_14_0_20_64_10]